MHKLDWKNESGDHFENHASELLLPVYPWLKRDFIDILQLQIRNTRILEIGCGPGFMLQQFAQESSPGLTGLDYSIYMLERARRSGRADGAHLLQGDACCLPFAPATFDAVFSRGSVFFWSDLHAAFTSIRNCLRPGGQALIGGGYGLSTPQEIVDAVKSGSGASHKGDIPRLDPDQLLEIASNTGGTAKILQAKKRGFWLHWQL